MEYKSLACGAMTLLSLITSTGAVYADCKWRGSLTPNGPAYLPPKILGVFPLSIDAHQLTIGANNGCRIKIDTAGMAKLFISNRKISSIKELDKNSAKEILGVPAGPQGEDENKAYYWSFEVFTIDPLEKNIYHIDVQFADAEQHWKKYRLRGYRIANEEWQSVE